MSGLSSGDLLYLQGGAISRRLDGVLGVHRKTAAGLQAIRDRWPGRVTVGSTVMPSGGGDLAGVVWADSAELRGINVIAQLSPHKVIDAGPALVHAPVNVQGVDELVGRVPVVLGDDYSPAVRTALTLLNTRGALRRARVRLGAFRRRHRFDALAARAPGFHANGYASAAHYAGINAATLRYFDHRITSEDIEKSRAEPSRDGEFLHVAFSGRFMAIKGIDFLPILAHRLARRGLPVRVSVSGAGEMEPQMREAAGGLVEFAGYLSFESEWKPYFRSSVDVAFLPHIQGDSSSTYFEVMGMGVPVLGFHNDSLTPLLADGGGGWAVPLGDLDSVMVIIESLLNDRGRLEDQRRRALAFMEGKTFEQVMDQRVDDFLRVSRVRSA